jgi:hypothetical protein
MRKKIFTFLLALATSVGLSWATENSIVINGTPQVGDNSISLTYYFDPANVPGITGYAPTLKVKCVTDNIWDEEWLSLSEIRSGTTTITLDNLGSFQAGKSYEVCFAYYNGSWVDEMFQSFTPAASTPSVAAARFVYNYDCQRSPAYPQAGSPCNLSGFSDPLVGYKGIGPGVGNKALGPWKLEFVGYYTPSNHYGCEYRVISAVNSYYPTLSDEEKQAKRLEVPIFRLWQYNLAAKEYQHASYGIICAYAAEANAQDHGALFISSESWGCFLTGHQHTSSFQISCENDLTTGMADLVAAASASDPDLDAVLPVIVSIDAIGDVELTQFCKDQIEGSRAAYNALSDTYKAQITNYNTLTDAEAAWADLVAAAQPYADAVIDLINAIPNPVVYTQDCKDKIDAAQAAYDALTDGQKILVTNAETLLQAPVAFINAAPYVHILFKANGNEKKVENVTLPKEFTDAEMKAMLKELYGVEGDYDMYAYSNSNADAVNISYEEWTISPFMGKVNVHGNMDKYDPQTGYEWIDFSLEISLELPPLAPTPTPTTAVVIGDPNDADQVTAFLTTYNGQLVPDLTIDHPVLNNMYNTLCLPFHMDADQIAASSLNGVEIYEFVDVDVTNDELYLYTSEEKHEIVAGRPYLVKYSAATQLEDLDFVNVTINNADLDDQAVIIKGVTFKGTFQPVVLGQQDGLDFNGGHLFLGQNNTLYWPNTINPLKPFRAYFTVNVDAGQSAGMPMRRGMPAHIGEPAQVPTGVENVQGDNVQGTKVVENGVLYIIKNGVKYNAQGQVVK